jgi:hypothetical protein
VPRPNRATAQLRSRLPAACLNIEDEILSTDSVGPPLVEMQRVLSKLHLLFDNIVSAANFALPESTGQTALGGSLEAAAAAGLTQ